MTNTIFKWAGALLMTVLLAACDSGPAQITQQTIGGESAGRGSASLNEGWQFRKGEGLALQAMGKFDDSWSEVELPHTWNVEDGSDGGDDYFRGDGWYHRELNVAQNLRGRRFYLHFNGANQITDVYINGAHIGRHEGGYAAFRFDITDSLSLGESNILSVKVNNARNDDIPPLTADFTFYGGIYRPVELIVTQPLHIEMMDYASPGVYIDQYVDGNKRGSLKIRSTLVNDGDDNEQAVVHYELRDASGNSMAQLSQRVALAGKSSVAINGSLSIDNPHLWQGIEDPYLYRLVVQVAVGDAILDQVVQPVGLRNFTVDPEKGAFLNGVSARLNGVSRHQDKKGKGWALSDEDHRQDFQLIADMGATAVRLAHYQHSQTIYQLADEMGLMVWAEVPVISEVTDSESFTASAKQQLIELIRQNYNHPSIVMWGLFNEISIHSSEGNAKLVRKLQRLAKKEDPNRLTTGAVLGDHNSEDVWQISDVVAQNRYDGWYYNDFDGMDTWLNKVRIDYPKRAIGISEYGAGSSIDIHSTHPKNQDHTEEYQNLYHEANWLIMRDHPAMWGNFIWNMFDFAADLRDEGSVPGLNNKGMVTFDREIKKDSYYWYQSHWRDEPLLYITSRRFDVRKTPGTDIKIYSNLPEVELVVNGQSQGVVTSDGSNRFVWADVSMKMGDNKIEARAKDLTDKVTWKRVLNDDTSLTSKSLGIDNTQHRIFNLPYGLTVAKLGQMLGLPYGASLIWPAGSKGEDVVAEELQFTVTAANSDSQVYSLARGALSLGRPVKASRELSHGMMGSPPAVASNVVDGNSRLDGESGEVPFWITADPNQGPGWLKIDLGSRYYVDRVDASWLPTHINDKGTIKYSIDIADEMVESAVVFAETYREVVDQRGNTTPLKTSDEISAVARYVRVNVLDSDYTFDVPVLGTFKLIGATEFSVYGGLVFSGTLELDYSRHVISLANNSVLSVADLLSQLQAVESSAALQIWSGNSRLGNDDTVKAGDYLLVNLPGDTSLRKERYDFVVAPVI